MGEFKWIWKSINERLGVVDPTPPGASLDDKVAARRARGATSTSRSRSRAELLAALDRANLAWGIVDVRRRGPVVTDARPPRVRRRDRGPRRQLHRRAPAVPVLER